MAGEYVIENNDTEDWNEDMIEDMTQAGTSPDFSSLVVYSRDWTIETIYSQIKQGNIDLNPKFQRRNVWADDKKARLIESLITGMPVPAIVLAEHRKKTGSFIVIDGKQRLLTIAGFMSPGDFKSWRNPKLGQKQLTVRKDLEGLTFDQMENDPTYEHEHRAFVNADVRCTVVANYQSPDVLYDIFYRLNTGAVPLSSQELRQVLNKGPFADYLMEVTQDLQPIHRVLKLTESDPRLRDIEMVLRFIALVMFSLDYRGNLQRFLDDQMGYITEKWEECSEAVKQVYADFNEAIKRLEKMLDSDKIGRRYTLGKGWERLNKVLFEVEAYYFMLLKDEEIDGKGEQFLAEFEKFCGENTQFRESIRDSTSDLEKYTIRYKLFGNFINSTFGTNIHSVPFHYNVSKK